MPLLPFRRFFPGCRGHSAWARRGVGPGGEDLGELVAEVRKVRRGEREVKP